MLFIAVWTTQTNYQIEVDGKGTDRVHIIHNSNWSPYRLCWAFLNNPIWHNCPWERQPYSKIIVFLIQGAIPSKKRGRRPYIGEACEDISVGFWAGSRRISQWHVGPSLLKVCNAEFSINFWTKTWLNLTSLQLPPVDWFEPLMVLDFIDPQRSTSQALAWVLL